MSKNEYEIQIGKENYNIRLIFKDDFDNFENFINLCTNTKWEMAGGKLRGHWRPGGSTLWCKQDFSGDLLIEFDGKLLPPEKTWIDKKMPDGGKNLNFRFLVTGPKHENILTFYCDLLKEGTGPNGTGDDQYNGYFFTWTYRHARLRWSPGYKKKAEKLDFLPDLKKEYHFRCLKVESRIRYWINDTLMFDYSDPNSHENGKIGFTIWRSAVEIDNLRVYRIIPK